jgi:hypothetical protein
VTNSDRLQEIRERAEKATKGPWSCWDGWGPIGKGYLEGFMAMARIGPKGGNPLSVIHASGETQQDIYAKRPDAEFIAASREDIPYLLQLVTEQQREIDRLKVEAAKRAEGTSRCQHLDRRPSRTVDGYDWCKSCDMLLVSEAPEAPEAKGYRKQEGPI